MVYYKLIQFIALGFILSSPLRAKTVDFPNFSDTSLLIFNGDAETNSSIDGTVLRLTPAQTNKSGSVFSQSTVNVSTFSTFFKFRITGAGGSIFDCNTASGGDGIVFVIQSVSSSIGGIGGSIGYGGIANSVGVEFDTWCNSANNDPNSNHLGILSEGNIQHTGELATKILVVTPRFDDGNIWYGWIDYNGSLLEVRTNQTGIRPRNADLSASIDIQSKIGGVNKAYIGFTSGTGLDFGNHDIISWEYRDQFNPIPGDKPQICENSSLSPNLILSIPRIEWNQGSFKNKTALSAELRHVPTADGRILFEVIDYKVLQ